MKRRQFVQASLSAAAFVAMGGCTRAEPSDREPDPPVTPTPRPAVQLYTVRTLLENDLEGTIRSVAEIGYEEVEPHSLFGRSAAEFRSVLDGAGLVAPARHVGLNALRGQINEVIEDTLALGCQWIICPYVEASERSLDGYRRVADDLNAAGAVCGQAGISFGYHNHDFEFEVVEDVIPYDLLLERTDPALVDMELDLFWVTKGGANPLSYFNKHPGRFPLCHVKDMAGDGSMVDVGSGIIDFATIFAASETAGLKHYIVEHDQPADPLASIAASYSVLRPLLERL